MTTLRATFSDISIAAVTRYIVMTMALTMLFLAQDDIAMAARVSTAFHIGLQPIGLSVAIGVVVSILGRSPLWRIIGCIPYGLLLVSIGIVAAQQHISFHIVLVYAGYFIQLILGIRNGDNHAAHP